MPQPTNTIDGTLRFLRIIHTVLFFSMMLYIFIAEKQIPHESRHLPQTIPIAYGLCSLAAIGAALYFRTNKLQQALETLQSKQGDVTAIQQWRFVGILSAVLLESVVLMGFALRFLGAPLKMSLPFYIVGIALMLLWWPQRP
jgi:hypothetical protein